MNPIATNRLRWPAAWKRLTMASTLPITIVGCNDTQASGLLNSIAPLTVAYVSERLGGDDDSDDSQSWYCWPACSVFD